MTIARFGRITPSQGAMLQLAGEVLTRSSRNDFTDEERAASIVQGYQTLKRLTKCDFGYDLYRWHEYLEADKDERSEYHHRYAWSVVRPVILRAITDPNRQRLIAMIPDAR